MLEPQTPEHHLLDTGFAQLSSASAVVFCPFSGSTALFAEPCFAQASFLRQIGNDRAGHAQCSEAFAASAPLGVPTNPSIGMVDSLSNLKHPTLAVLSSWHKQTVKKLAPSALAAFLSYFPAEGHGAESAHALSDAGPAVRRGLRFRGLGGTGCPQPLRPRGAARPFKVSKVVLPRRETFRGVSYGLR